MKKQTLFVLASVWILLAIISFFIYGCGEGLTSDDGSGYTSSWHITSVTTGAASYPQSLAIDKEGEPCFVLKRSGTNELIYMRRVSSSWETTLVDYDDDINYYYPSLQFDSFGNPHIAYNGMHSPTATYIKYAKLTGTTWETEVVIAETNFVKWLDSPSLAIDPITNRPKISFTRNQEGVFFAEWTGTTWEVALVTTEGGSSDHWGSLALSDNGTPEICYYDADANVLGYARLNGSTWETDFVSYAGEGHSLKLNSDNDARITFFAGSTLKYAKWNSVSSTWEIELIDDSSTVTGAYNSLVLDYNGNPKISYKHYDGSNGHLKFARNNGASWQTEIVEGNIDVVCSSIGLDEKGNPIILYKNNAALGMRLAEWY